ncbi:ligand-binding sensor domain-containing protein [Tenacibaculum sp. TC6]|uniref:ligand-binding sensor domain-containing protein n=1 Tax=Tenacibaculum sp. TC6 TaxID=3423223 RepID=UPI003D36B4E4
MKSTLSHITLIIVLSIFISCNGQGNHNNKSQPTATSIKPAKIPVPKNGFNSGMIDSKGTFWFGSNGSGVFHYNGKTYTNYTRKDGLSSNQVFSIVEDSNNNVWFGTQNGLTKYNRKQFKHLPLPFQDTSGVWLAKMYPVINPNAVHSLATDANDNLWIGTAGGGAYSYDGTNFKSFLTEIGKKQEDGLHHNWTPYITRDTQGAMWFTSMTHGGISRFNGKEFKQFLIEDGLSDNMVRTLYCDASGNLWIGFNGNRNSGLTVYNGTTFKTFSVEDGICSKRIHAIFEDNNGNIWLGSPLGNLCIYDGTTFNEFKSKDGRTFSGILFIFEDANHTIWFGGRYGIWNFDGENIQEISI